MWYRGYGARAASPRSLEAEMQELIFGLIGGTALLMYGVDKMGEAWRRLPEI